jgi:hypothetical protein
MSRPPMVGKPMVQEFTVTPNERPLYKYVGKKGFFAPNDELISFGTQFYLDESVEPNEDFEPLNKTAREAMIRFYDKLDAGAREKAARDGKHFAPMPRKLGNEYVMPKESDRKVQIVRGGEGVSVLGVSKVVSSFSKVEDKAIPETGNRILSKVTGVEAV